jgi:hypothetical protein
MRGGGEARPERTSGETGKGRGGGEAGPERTGSATGEGRGGGESRAGPAATSPGRALTA